MTSNKLNAYLILSIDLAIVFLSYYFAFRFRYVQIDPRNWEAFLSLLPWILLASLMMYFIYDYYNFMKKTSSKVISSIIVTELTLVVITMGASFLLREFALPRSIILLALIIRTSSLIFWKVSFKNLYNSKKVQHVLLVGDENESTKLMNVLQKQSDSYNQVRFLRSSTELNLIKEKLGKFDLVVLGSNLDDQKKSQIMYHAMKLNKNVFIVPALYELLLSKSIVTHSHDTMLLGVSSFGLSSDQLIIKRVIDIGFSFISLIILSPIFFITGTLIKLQEPKAPVFYSQKRLGKNNCEFTIYKFRSMVCNAEKDTGPVLSSSEDERITKIGKLIRRTRIDELPQLVNVLKGDMSIVGPRPERLAFMQEFIKNHKDYNYRSTVKPGITGYAQVMGKYTTDVEDKLRFDLLYIRSYSLLLDISIILKTIAVVLDKTKAEGKYTNKKDEASRKTSANL
ncbi:sugar transferase [Halobacillus litoralis]|uniref:sugar transferase n=1 Tax=Halobacillus litoralis TaxID=45668 RepID=UPI001CD3890E|nr:sugar transferase [Halobacillus litoralis]MCA0970969.1 sugar transferase [Halobacillus litoralis]